MASSSAAAATVSAAAVPFHCIICFDEFNVVERPPVVLPCGHTYVCQPCSKRLTKCMECRMPLVWTTSKQPAAGRSPSTTNSKLAGMGLNVSPSNNSGNRYRTTQSSPPLQPRAPSPTPADQNVHMPKNLVLMALMESSQWARQVVDSNETSVDEEEEEITRVAVGIEALTGTCGTYAVRERDGLAVLPQHPQRQRNSFEEEEQKEPELEEGIEPSSSESQLCEPFTVEKGQTLQVVRMEDGVVTLARDKGYVVASSQQLVKVGGPLDSACQLEGMFDLVEDRKRELEKKLQDFEKLEVDLMERIQKQREEEPTHPVITPIPNDHPTWLPVDDEDSTGEGPSRFLSSSSSGQESASSFVLSPRTSRQETAYVGGQNEDRAVYTPSRDVQESSELEPCTPHTIDNADLCPNQEAAMDYGCTTLFGEGLLDKDENDTNPLRQSVESVNRVAAQAARLRTPSLGGDGSSSPGSSFDSGCIDWRTGMSGHRALLSVKICSAPMYRGEIRMMSEHNGIARVRRPSARRSPTQQQGYKT